MRKRRARRVLALAGDQPTHGFDLRLDPRPHRVQLAEDRFRIDTCKGGNVLRLLASISCPERTGPLQGPDQLSQSSFEASATSTRSALAWRRADPGISSR